MPAPYRININNEEIAALFVTIFTLPAIEFCPKKLDKIIEAIDTLNPFEEKRDIFSTSILANSYQLNLIVKEEFYYMKNYLNMPLLSIVFCLLDRKKLFKCEPDKFKKFSLSAQKKL